MCDFGDYPVRGFAQQGWQCPICGRVYAPSTPMCYYCGGESKCTTTTEKTITIDGTQIPVIPCNIDDTGAGDTKWMYNSTHTYCTTESKPIITRGQHVNNI